MQTNLEASGMMDFWTLLPDLCPGGIYLVSPSTGEILYKNRYFSEEWGCSEESLVFEREFLSFLFPEDQKVFLETFLSLPENRNRDSLRLEMRILPADLSGPKWFSLEKKRIQLPQLKGSYHLVFVQDITAQKTNERNIQEQFHFFLGLFENASLGMALQDGEGGYFRINSRFTEITGYEFSDLTELNVKRTNGEEISLQEKEYFVLLKEGVEETSLTRKDGRRISVYRRCCAFRNVDGKPDFYYVFIDDVTDKKQKESYQIHSQKMETIGSLATNIAHDLNNYLQPIHVFSKLGKDLLEQKNLNEKELFVYFEKIQSGADNARSMIHRIIQYSKGNESEVLKIVEIHELIESTIPLLMAGLPKNVDLRFDLVKENLRAKVEPIRLSKILCEITSGGFLPWDGIKKGFVLIKTEILNDERCRIQLELNGLSVGSPSEFEVLDFLHISADSFLVSNLDTINRSIRNWGGDFFLKKPNPELILVCIDLPISITETTNDVLPPVPKASSSLESAWSQLKQKRFWIVEDDIDTREAIKLVLAQKEIEPKFFPSGIPALSFLEKEKPDFVLSDYRLRDMTGLDLLYQMKNKVPDLCTVLYTGNSFGLDSEELLSEGILVRSKPISVDELYETILLSFGFL